MAAEIKGKDLRVTQDVKNGGCDLLLFLTVQLWELTQSARTTISVLGAKSLMTLSGLALLKDSASLHSCNQEQTFMM